MLFRSTSSVQKVKVLKIIPEENLILVNSGIPGATGSMVYITRTNKKIPKPPAPPAAKGKAKKDAAKPAAKPAAKK